MTVLGEDCVTTATRWSGNVETMAHTSVIAILDNMARRKYLKRMKQENAFCSSRV